MTYKKAMWVAAVALALVTAHDINWMMSGKFGSDSYIPLIYPFALIVFMVGMTAAKRHGIWD